MTDFEKECDATLEAARKNLAEGDRLMEQCLQASMARKEWEKANGIDAEKRQRFFAGLSPENRKMVEEENERFDRELAHEMERLGPSAAKKNPGGKIRKYV